MEEELALFIPVVALIVICLLVYSFFHFRYKTRVKVQETIQAALDKGNELTPELIDRVAGPQPHTDRDLRRGLVSIAIGVAFAILGLLIEEEDALRPMIGVGMFPFLVGLAYIIMWRVGKSES